MWRFGLMLLVGPVGAAGQLIGCGQPGAGVSAGPVDPATPVALLAVVEGQVKVRQEGGALVAAAADMTLARTDTVITSPGALVVVVLANGYVIKLEEDQATPVRALAHLDDPPATESVAELFERALGAEAFARVGGADRIERIAGWNARRASGETPAPVAKSEAAPVREVPTAASPAPVPEEEAADVAAAEEKKADARAEGSTASSAPAKPVKPSDAKRGSETRPSKDDIDADDAPPKPGKKKSSSSEVGGSVPKTEGAPGAPPPTPAPQSEPERAPSEPDLVESWTFEPGDGTHVSKTRLPALLAGQRRALAECLESAAASELRLRVGAGVVKEVVLRGGKPAPDCAKGLVGKALAEAGGDGWVVVRARR